MRCMLSVARFAGCVLDCSHAARERPNGQTARKRGTYDRRTSAGLEYIMVKTNVVNGNTCFGKDVKRQQHEVFDVLTNALYDVLYAN